MRNLRYDGPGHRLRLPSGRTVDRDTTGEVTNADADAAQASKRQQITISPQDDTPEATGEGHDTDTSEEA